ncbi:hypothetical protein [Micromonospora saelicesensis]|uniref:hypothetical protein n=1 Tax=Micromonospora saelicesensis TaxID=285676 RepID=UPI0011BD54AA|nr:hypothetical protein [Micromonospora saelicesensis]
MDESKAGEYRLWRQASGSTGFAWVKVETKIAQGQGRPDVRWAVDAADKTSAQPKTDPEFVDAALEGVVDAINALLGVAEDVSTLAVDVVWLGASIVDTESTAVRAAACAATAKSVGRLELFEIVHDGGGWKCQLAAPPGLGA